MPKNEESGLLATVVSHGQFGILDRRNLAERRRDFKRSFWPRMGIEGRRKSTAAERKATLIDLPVPSSQAQCSAKATICDTRITGVPPHPYPELA